MTDDCGRLRYIELENYKSYKGKKIIGPFSNFTAVIGPNGSGKSNLMDAISFVLGEHTKHLRVRRLNDLVHGAVVGKPISKTASVTAVYQMPSGEEVRFSRVINGNTSEYRINGSAVRVDEYSEALEKIHIFMKVKNFLVFQGAVENIAMKNARERCQMFEEISKSADLKEEYERAKAEMHCLEEEAAQNLNRKKGIVAERKEARIEIDEAEKYRRYRDDLDQKRLEYHMFKLYYNEAETKGYREEINQREDQLRADQQACQTIEEEVKDKKREAAKAKKDQTGLEQDIKKCDQKLSKRKPEFIKVSQMLKHLTDKHRESKVSLENARQARSNQLQEIEQLESEYEKIKSLQNEYELQQTKKSLEQGRNLELEDNQLAEYHSLKLKVAENTTHISSVLDQLNRECNEQKDLSDALDRRKKEIENSLKRKETENMENRKRLQTLVGYIESNNRGISEQRATEEQLAKEVEAANKRIDEINKDLEEVVTQLGEAKVERHESSRAAKKQELIENLKRLFSGVHGRLLEMCQPSHRRYQVAITKVLGKYMDAIVCDTEKTAKECIQYMKDQRIEPETFLPLDYLDVHPIDEKLREISDPPNVHLVIDVITCDPPTVKKALQFACGNALVCETVDHARQVAYSSGDRKKTVSLEGTLFQRSGVISGGASDLKARARRWDEKQINSLMTKRDSLQNELKEQLKVKRKEAELRIIQLQVKGLETRLKYSQKDKESMEEKLLTSTEEEINQMTQELNEVNERLQRCQTRMQELQISLNAEQLKMDSAEDQVFRDFCTSIGVENIRQYEDRELRVARERDRKRLEFTNQLQRVGNQLEYEKSRDTNANVKRWEKTVENERDEIEKCRKQERKIHDEMEVEENKKQELEYQLNNMRQRAEDLESDVAEIKRRQAIKQKEIQKQQKELSHVESRMELKRAERHSLLQMAKIEDLQLPLKSGQHMSQELETILSSGDSENVEFTQEETQRIYELESKIPLDYKVLDKSLRHIQDEKEVSKKADELQSAVDQLAHNLARIQAPNLRAGDKLGSVEQRLRNTEAEFEDTRRKAKRAKAHFEKIRRARHNAFLNCFNSISDNIDPIYKSLARNTGAQASLLPTNMEEPYLEEIQFQCVAPGKRFQQMDSLSGGEKTIAALALLFAMHRFNPSPFFVLDEIDAALDNTNIGKVASFIREYAMTRAQIIVISLKEEFYSRADTLVGIYPTTLETQVSDARLAELETILVKAKANLQSMSISSDVKILKGKSQAESLSMASQPTINGVPQIKASLKIFADHIVQGEVMIVRANGSVVKTFLKEDGPGSQYIFQQIQDCINCLDDLLDIINTTHLCEESKLAVSSKHFLLNSLNEIRRARQTLESPKRRSIDEHLRMQNYSPSGKQFFNPALPKDIVLSLFIYGSELAIAVYIIKDQSIWHKIVCYFSQKITLPFRLNHHERQIELIGRCTASAVLPRLQNALDLLTQANDLILYLLNRDFY